MALLTYLLTIENKYTNFLVIGNTFSKLYVDHLDDTTAKLTKPGIVRSGEGGGERTLECNMTGRCPFLKNLHNLFREKMCISILCFGIFRLLYNREK